jgi:hypothetical protein
MIVLLTGCSMNGDFGRMRNSLAYDDVHAWMGPAATGAPRDALWEHQLTDEERQLRDLGYALSQPPYDRNRWYSALGDLGVQGLPWSYTDRSSYATQLFTTAYRSQTARYNKMIEDIRNDVTRLDPFFSIAHYVTGMDAKREKALAFVSSLSAEERAKTLQRIKENRAIVRWVASALRARSASYKFALERLVIAAPSPVAVEAERALTLLQQRISAYTA